MSTYACLLDTNVNYDTLTSSSNVLLSIDRKGLLMSIYKSKWIGFIKLCIRKLGFDRLCFLGVRHKARQEGFSHINNHPWEKP